MTPSEAPPVVLDDADVDAATFGAFMNSGQICMSTERVVVDEAIADAFVARLEAKAERLPLGDPRDTAAGRKVDPGYGRFVGRAGIEAFPELRWLTLQTTPRHYPF